MTSETLRLLRDFFHTYSKGKCAPDEQETCEKLQVALQKDIDCEHQLPGAHVYSPRSGRHAYRYCARCSRHWTWVDGAWLEDTP
jgi:hypothetical protein